MAGFWLTWFGGLSLGINLMAFLRAEELRWLHVLGLGASILVSGMGTKLLAYHRSREGR